MLLNDVIEMLYLLKLFEYYNRNCVFVFYIILEGKIYEYFGIMDEEFIFLNFDG